MAYCSEQIYLDRVTKFKDVTGELLNHIENDFPIVPGDSKESWRNMCKRNLLYKHIIRLAFAYREEVNHPESYMAQVEAGESQLP